MFCLEGLSVSRAISLLFQERPPPPTVRNPVCHPDLRLKCCVTGFLCLDEALFTSVLLPYRAALSDGLRAMFLKPDWPKVGLSVASSNFMSHSQTPFPSSLIPRLHSPAVSFPDSIPQQSHSQTPFPSSLIPRLLFPSSLIPRLHSPAVSFPDFIPQQSHSQTPFPSSLIPRFHSPAVSFPDFIPQHYNAATSIIAAAHSSGGCILTILYIAAGNFINYLHLLGSRPLRSVDYSLVNYYLAL